MANHKTTCPDCNHSAHEAAQCKQCNCGEGDISHSDAVSTDYSRVVTLENFKRGKVSTRDVTHIKARQTGNI